MRLRDLVSLCLAIGSAFLAGCSTLVSERPVFASEDFDSSPVLLGRYASVESGPDSVRYYVDRSGVAGLRITGFHEVGEKWQQIFYGEGGAIALGGGDYVLQMSCLAYRGDTQWQSAALGPPHSPWRRFTAYGLAIRDRRAGDYWVLQSSTGLGHEDTPLYRRFGIEERKIPGMKQGDEDRIDILPHAISPSQARTFFAVAVLEVMAGRGQPVLVAQERAGANDASSRSEVAKAVEVSTTGECREIADGSPRFEGK